MRLRWFDRLTVLLGIAVIGTTTEFALAQADDHGDDRDTATILDYDIAQSGTIDAAFSDVDVFRVDLQGRATVQFRSTRNVDTIGTLYDSEGGYLTSHDDIDLGGGNLNFLITTELDRGVYYLAVEGFGVGDYDVLSRFDLIGDDHGDTFGSSTVLPLGPRIAGNMNYKGDEDWFRIDFPVRTYAEVHTVSQSPVITELHYPTGDGFLRPELNNATRGTTRFRWYGTWEGTYYVAIVGSVSAYNIRVEADDTGCAVAVVQMMPEDFDVLEQDSPLVSTPKMEAPSATNVE